MYLSFRGLGWYPWYWPVRWFSHHRLATWYCTWSNAPPLHHKEETGFNLWLNQRGTWCMVWLGVRAVCWPCHRRSGWCYWHWGQLDVWSEVWYLPSSFLAQQGAMLLVIQWNHIWQWKLFSGELPVIVYMKNCRIVIVVVRYKSVLLTLILYLKSLLDNHHKGSLHGHILYQSVHLVSVVYHTTHISI